MRHVLLLPLLLACSACEPEPEPPPLEWIELPPPPPPLPDHAYGVPEGLDQLPVDARSTGTSGAGAWHLEWSYGSVDVEPMAELADLIDESVELVARYAERHELPATDCNEQVLRIWSVPTWVLNVPERFPLAAEQRMTGMYDPTPTDRLHADVFVTHAWSAEDVLRHEIMHSFFDRNCWSGDSEAQAMDFERWARRELAKQAARAVEVEVEVAEPEPHGRGLFQRRASRRKPRVARR